MIISTWNVNSIKVRIHAVLQYLSEYSPDVLALQETKTLDENFPVSDIEALGYHISFLGQKTYNGVAIISKVKPESIDYINTHGTSTPVGDINELKALKLALGDHIPNHTSISSTKSMTGHLLGAAAAIEAVFCVKALHHSFIPPTINIDDLDPDCDFDVTPNVGKSRDLDLAMSNSFGFGGTNASIIFCKI